MFSYKGNTILEKLLESRHHRIIVRRIIRNHRKDLHQDKSQFIGQLHLGNAYLLLQSVGLNRIPDNACQIRTGVLADDLMEINQNLLCKEYELSMWNFSCSETYQSPNRL
jgi:hypothetical protein